MRLRLWCALLFVVMAACGREVVKPPLAVLCDGGPCGDGVAAAGDAAGGDPASGECFSPSECTTPPVCQALPAECVDRACIYTPDDASTCDDGDLCTDDQCRFGECVGSSIPCGDPPAAFCEGETYHYWLHLGACDPQTGECFAEHELDCSPDCQVNCLEACEVVTCAAQNGGCRVGSCVPGSVPATCQYQNANDGTICDRIDFGDGVCLEGSCVECIEDDDCSVCHTCGDAHACVPVAPETVCDDGRFCNGGDRCDAEGGCTIHSGNPCAPYVGDGDDDCSESCNETINACTAHDPSGSACDDGQYCNGVDTCGDSGTCSNHSGDPCASRVGDDDDDCSESCNEQDDTCTATDPQNSACNDGDLCNGTDTCNANGSCSVHSGDPCASRIGDDDDDCSESCNPVNGACTSNDPPSSFCDDGDPCNGTDSCSSGQCALHSGDPCASRVGDGDADCSESCNPSTGACTADDPPASSCNLNDPCISNESCSGGACVGTGCTGGLLCAPGVGCRDPDANQAACESEHTWVDGTWHASLYGTPNCCGDDSGENEQQKVIYWGAWQVFNRDAQDVWACCSSGDHCVNDGSGIQCYAEGHNLGPTQLCVDGSWYNCNAQSVCFEHFGDVPDERCLRTGADTYAWADVSVVSRDGSNPREGLAWEDQNYANWGNENYLATNNQWACCQAATDCVNNSGVCRAQGYVLNGTTDWLCDGGYWYECGPNGADQSRQGLTCEWNSGLGEYKWQ